MVKEGYYFGVPPLLFGAILLFFSWRITGALLVAFGLFCFSFFRDPRRAVPSDPGLIVSPADGRIVVITPEANEGRAGIRLSIFLAIWNVHVNRAPAAGVIEKIEYRPGKFLAAWDSKASQENEQNTFSLATAHGRIEFKQIAGFIARRVVSWKNPRDVVERGERVGLVRFGSRVDLWLPAGCELLVKVGDNVHGGSSALAHWPVPAPLAATGDALASSEGKS
jgi:phosphatidylserine decarboxylase